MTLDKNQPMENILKDILSSISNSYSRRIDYLIKPEFVKCDEKEVSLTFRYKVEEWELNHFDTMHGGMISTIFDNAIGCLAHYIVGGGLVTTATLSTNYIKPMPYNSNIIITAKADSIGKTLINISAKAYVEETNTLAATSTAIYMVIKKPLKEIGKK